MHRPQKSALKRRLRKSLIALAVIASGVTTTLLAQFLLERFKKPALSVQYSMTIGLSNTEGSAGKTTVRTQIWDMKTRRIAALSDVSAPDSSLQVGPSKIALQWKFLVSNTSKYAVTNLGIAIYSNVRGRTSLEWPPNIHATLSEDERPGYDHVDVINVPALPARATGVFTYRLETNSDVLPSTGRPRNFIFDTPYWTSTERGQEDGHAELLSIYKMVARENRLRPGVASLFTVKLCRGGKLGQFEQTVQLFDPEGTIQSQTELAKEPTMVQVTADYDCT